VAKEEQGRSEGAVVVVRDDAAAAAGRTKRVGRQEAHKVENTAAFRHVQETKRATVVVVLLLRVAQVCALRL
jgi:hypothetical protein